mmetsp:Transcript_37148/g.90302  ORF Transcript_37148/g.90302 Transcript_37148/m.90302 type:complete len:229 (-) Transcript_37148:233-919(-)
MNHCHHHFYFKNYASFLCISNSICSISSSSSNNPLRSAAELVFSGMPAPPTGALLALSFNSKLRAMIWRRRRVLSPISDSFSMTLTPSNGFGGGAPPPDLRWAGAALAGPPARPRAKWAKSGFLANSSEKSSSCNMRAKLSSSMGAAAEAPALAGILNPGTRKNPSGNVVGVPRPFLTGAFLLLPPPAAGAGRLPPPAPPWTLNCLANASSMACWGSGSPDWRRSTRI